MATTKIDVPYGTWVEIMPLSTSAFGIVETGRIRWKRDTALPTDPLDPVSSVAGREAQIDASGSQATYGTATHESGASFIRSDD